MAIKQSDWASGRRVTATSGEAGEVMCERFTYIISSNLSAGDIIEMGPLPAFATPVDATLVSDKLGTVTLDAGIMSGEFGSADQSRTCGAELFSAAADASAVRMSLPGGFRLTSVDKDRGIGVKVSAAITAANQRIDLLLYFRQ